MFCSKCGKELADDAVFCIKCGFKVGTDCAEDVAEVEENPIVVEEKKDTPAPPPVVEEQQPKKKRGGKIFLLLLIIAAIIFGAPYITPFVLDLVGGVTIGGVTYGGPAEYYSVNDVIDTENFTFQILDVRFVESADFSTFEGNETATAPNAQGETILYLKFSITNKGNKDISLFTDPVKVLVGDIVYDDTNAVINYYCIEKDDNDGEIAPLATKTYNYCVFNLPGAVLENTDTSVTIELYGKDYVINLY